MKTALLLVDLQNDFLLGKPLEPAPESITAAAASLLDAFRNQSLPVIHARTSIDPAVDDRMPHWKSSGTRACERGTAGHAFPPALEPVEGEPIIEKTFFNPFENGRLAEWLGAVEAGRIVIAGVHLHACVRTAALEAYERGMDVVIPADATGSYDPLHAAATRRFLARRGSTFLKAAEILECLAGKVPWSSGDSGEGRASAAFESSRAAFEQLAAAPASTRRELLLAWHSRLERASEDLASMLVREIGKPVLLARAEIARSLDLLRLAAAEARTAVAGPGARRVPVGTIAIITPFNNPVAIPAGKIGPALAHGNTVVWKPAPAGLRIAQHMAELFSAAGAPAGIMEIVPGGSDAAQECMERADAVSLSGSAAAGWVAREVCTRRNIPLQAELGGNNAAIVWRDADLSAAARMITDGAFAFGGQRCTANRRAIIDEAVAGRFWEILVAALPHFQPADPALESTRIGPLVDEESAKRVRAMVSRAGAAGCRVVGGGGEGRIAIPALVLADDPDLEIVREETFGPVLVVQVASSWDRAIELCNGVRQGLVAACFSSDPHRRTDFMRRARCGILKLDQSTSDAAADLPFGGWKASGTGTPEHGAANIEFFTRWQAIYSPAT